MTIRKTSITCTTHQFHRIVTVDEDSPGWTDEEVDNAKAEHEDVQPGESLICQWEEEEIAQ